MSGRKGSGALLAPSDVAEIAGVTRAAVSQWRKREKEPLFPAATAGTDSRPLFDRDDVLAWLSAEGKQINSAKTRAFWDAANAHRGALPLDLFADIIFALASVRVLSERSRDGVWDKWRRRSNFTFEDLQWEAARYNSRVGVIAQIGAHGQRLDAAGLVDLVSSVPAAELAEACDFLLERAGATQLHVSAGHGAVKSPAAELLTTLAGAYLPANGILHDPACGIGVVMTAVLADSLTASATGYEINVSTAQRAYQRAVLMGVDERIEVLAVDTLEREPRPELKADVIALEPPFGMRAQLSPLDQRFPAKFPATASDLAWVFHTVAHLKPGGRGFVLVPPNVLTSNAARQARSILLERGHVHQIITLPNRMVPHTSISLALWVVGDKHTSDEVTFIDAREIEHSARLVPTWIGGEQIEAPHATVSTSSVLANEARLDPASWIEWAPGASRDELIMQGRASLDALKVGVRELAGIESQIRFPEVPESVRVLSLDDLMRNGWLEIVNARALVSAKDEQPANRVTGRQVDGHELRGVPSIDGDRTTKGGDVLFATVGPLKSAVDHAGGHVLGADVHALRVTPDSPITAGYLALALTGNWNARFTTGTIPRVNLHDVEIPVPPLETQVALIELDETLMSINDHAARVAQSAEAAITNILDAVRQAC